MKKSIGIIAFMSVFLSSFVSAGPIQGLEQLADGIREAIFVVIRFISELILDINSFDEFLFAKLILFTLILLVVYSVIKNSNILGTEKNKAIQWIVSSAVSILAIRYLPDSFIQAILLQYGALAVGLTVFLPLMIFFFFIHQAGTGPFVRQAGWVVFAASFFALWSFRYEELGQANMIYWIAIGFIVVALIFDKRIHEYFGLSSIRKYSNDKKIERRAEAQKKLDDLEDNKKYLTDKEYDKLYSRYTRELKHNL